VLFYALTIFCSAFLLFEVQPLIGKFVLPWFGGTPAVWTTCMLFFQVLLLLGYGYAHLLIRHLSPRTQRAAHLTVLFVSFWLLVVLEVFWKSPILPSASWKPQNSGYPTWKVIQLLTVSVGLPFWILSATGPLLQGWFSRAHPGASPYRLYALSNLGSLLALVSYPFLVEPAFSLKMQALVWSWGYITFTVLCAYCALLAARPQIAETELSGRRATSAGERNRDPAGLSSLAAPHLPEPDHPGWSTCALWLGLPACASVMLLATTNQICQEVAVIPFLWILPLCLYLLSFVLCFENDRWYSRRLFMLALLPAVGMACVVLYKGVHVKIPLQILIYSFALFVCCMFCHGELAGLKPASRYLTSFYLTVATGGASGGIFVGLVAPHLFNGYWELHLGLWLTCFLALVILVCDKDSWVYRRHPWPAGIALLSTFVLASSVLDEDFPDSLIGAVKNVLHAWQTGLVAFAVIVLMGIERSGRLRLNRSRPWFAVSCLLSTLGTLGFVFHSHAKDYLEGSVTVLRNFYGVLVVVEEDPEEPKGHLYRLRHGRTTHGLQFQTEDKRYLPTSYYGLNSGIGLALFQHPRRLAMVGARERNLRIGVVGLGVGTIAAYARAGDYLRYYEINPNVVGLSLGANSYFTYLKHCPGKVDVILGDARISMESELERNGPQGFDLLAIDAFNSDAIPVHLLTQQAMAVYLKHLRAPDGIVAIHISNRYLDLRPVVWGLADHFDLASAYIDSSAVGDLAWGSSWMLLAQNPKILQQPEIAKATTPRNVNDYRSRLWTDDYSNLFQILKK